jgi:hypothetical protein
MIDANFPPMLIEWLYAGIVQKLVVVVTSVDTNQVSFHDSLRQSHFTPACGLTVSVHDTLYCRQS